MWQQVELALSQSTHRVMVKLASFLPALFALLVAILVLTLIGAGVAALLRRILTSARFDERLARNSIHAVSDWVPSHSPTQLVARIVFWAMVVIGCFIGVSAFDAAYPGDQQLSLMIIPYLSRAVGAIVLLIVGTIIARFLARSVLIGAVNAKLQYARFLSLGVKWLVLVLTAAMVLDHLQLGGVVVELAFGILFGGIVLTLALAVGLGSREIVSRSLEKNVERDFDNIPGAGYKAPPPDNLRHF
ncbi:mechanosensitive ion channel family protein [Edaphobacter sp.]|uniref:mechanosensitive ion channel family protein n=1 Tax=Edaphobacter sp. TaxID=1934404 RepID=UPI002DBAD40C|nr:hypothetical protein [Edaphobacter sp.]HEU5340673.1 hypothetical protein [Edaphobacter sp.]